MATRTSRGAASASATPSDASAPTQGAAPQPRLLDRAVWRDATLVWLIQHALVLLFAYAGARGIDPRYPVAQMFLHWSTWDGGIYAGIALFGYQASWQMAFYPLFPGLERLLLFLPGLNVAAAGMIIASASELGAFGLLRALVAREYGTAIARRALICLALFPTAFFFVAPYAESLFLLLSVACFLALRQRRWLLAGCLAALAALTRPVGILLIVPIIVEYLTPFLPAWPGGSPEGGWWMRGARFLRSLWARVSSERGELRRTLAAVALPMLALAGFYAALVPTLGAQSPAQAETLNWFHRDLAPPWTGYQRAIAALLGPTDIAHAGHIILDLAFTAIFIALTVSLWRRMPPAYVAYAWVSLLVVLVEPAQGWLALASTMRFMLVVFPLFIRLGQWGAKPWANALILGLSLLLLAALTATFTVGGWVA